MRGPVGADHNSGVRRLRRWTRAAMRRTARDDTVANGPRTALVVAPHPDDETLGCGATILRKVAAGTRVTVAVLTDGRHSHRSAHLSPDDLAALRRAEMAEAAARLGLLPGAVRWGGFVDGSLAGQEDKVAALIGELLGELRPEEVYVTSADEPHPDHAAAGRAARQAVGEAVRRESGLGRIRLLEYPVWLWGGWPLRRGDRLGSLAAAGGLVLGRRAVKVRCGEFLSTKLNALEAHASQLRRPEPVPVYEEWATLPLPVLDAASDPDELFLPWPQV